MTDRVKVEELAEFLEHLHPKVPIKIVTEWEPIYSDFTLDVMECCAETAEVSGMRNVRFPEPVTFDTFGGPQTEGAAVKVLEEAAELVEAVKELERLPSSPDGPDGEPLWKVQARERVLDEAMDVYQAIANFTDGEMERDVFSLSFVEFGKDAALSVLLHAAALYSDSRWSGGYRAEWVRWTMWALANLIGDEFGDGEIADAYARCVERNRERGRL